MRHPHPWRPALLATTLAAAAQLACAQAGTPQTVEVTGSAERDNPAVAGSALRVALPIDKTPQSVVVLDRALLDQQGVRTLTEALANVSAVRGTDSRDRFNFGLRIRGFAAGVLVDGMALPGQFSTPDSLVAVQRVEVVKGPAGTLHGGSQSAGNAGFIGGLVALTTAAPDTRAAAGQVRLRGGTRDEAGFTLGWNQPLGSTLAVRVDADLARAGSETDRLTERRQAAQLGLAWRPDRDRELVLRVRHSSSRGLDYAGLPRLGTLTPAAYTVPRSRNLAAAALPDTTGGVDSVNLQWQQRLDARWSWALTVAHVDANVDQRGSFPLDSTTFTWPAVSAFDGPAYGLYGARLWNRMRSTVVSPALTGRFDGAGARHTLVAGLDIDRTRDDAFLRFSPGFGFLGLVDITNPVPPAWAEPDTTGTPDQRNRYRSTGVYLQDHADFGALQLLASLRHNRVKVTDVNAAFGVSNLSQQGKTLGRVGAVYAFTPQVSAFAGWGQGMRVPTFAVFSSPPRPELSTQTELGLRLANLGGLSATLALFDLRLKNAISADPAHPGQSLQLGSASSKGADLDLRWQVTPAWQWLASLTRQNPKVDDTGLQTVDMPKTSARLATRYEMGAGSLLPGLGIGLGLTHHGARPGDAANTYFTPAATVLDAQASYRLGRSTLGLVVSNLADKAYWVPSRYFGGGQVTPAPRRSVSATATFDF